MIELRPPGVTAETRAQPRILLPNWWIRFVGMPDYLAHVKDKTMRVVKQVQVHYELSYILKEATYKDINLSNDDTGVKLYPDAGDNLYELTIGLKPGNYYLLVYFPAEQPIYRLDFPTMTPLPSDNALKYLGTIKPEDSPVDNPAFKLYLVYELKPIIIRIVADDSWDYTKASLSFLINRCQIQAGMPPDNVVPKDILYLDALKW